MASGEMSAEEFTEFLATAFRLLAAAQHRRLDPLRLYGFAAPAGDPVCRPVAYTELKNLIVWVKDNGGMGTFYRSRHELVFAFKNGTAPHINTFELGQHGRYRTNVWEYRGVNSFGRTGWSSSRSTRPPSLSRMVADAIKDVSARNGIILDAFGGSGSTLIAAHKTGRRARIIELDPIYVDRIIRRWETFAHDDAVLSATGESFAQVTKTRRQAGVEIYNAGQGDSTPLTTRSLKENM